MEVATIKGATHNPGAPRNWTEANGPCGSLPIRYQKDAFGNNECISAWKPTPEELQMLNDGGFVILSVSGWQVPVSLYVESKDVATEGRRESPSGPPRPSNPPDHTPVG